MNKFLDTVKRMWRYWVLVLFVGCLIAGFGYCAETESADAVNDNQTCLVGDWCYQVPDDVEDGWGGVLIQMTFSADGAYTITFYKDGESTKSGKPTDQKGRFTVKGDQIEIVITGEEKYPWRYYYALESTSVLKIADINDSDQSDESDEKEWATLKKMNIAQWLAAESSPDKNLPKKKNSNQQAKE